jgi:hypothetical protein
MTEGGETRYYRLATSVRFGHLARYPVEEPSAMDQRLRHDDEARRTAALMGFIVILVLAIAGVVLVRELRDNSRLEDCLMAGRRNCAPIETPLRRP